MAEQSNGWRRLKKNRAALASLGFLILVVLACFIGPYFFPEEMTAGSAFTFQPPGARVDLPVKDPLDAAKTLGTKPVTFLLGSDDHGKDLFARVLAGGRVSLLVGIAAGLVNLLIGVAYGITAGFVGGRTGQVLMRIIDLLNSIPQILIIMVFIASFSGGFVSLLDGGRLWAEANGHAHLQSWFASLLPYNRILIVILSIGLIEWLTMARIIRGQVLVLREQQYIAAARAMGQSTLTIMVKHLLPNLWTIILTCLTLTIPAVVLDESFLSFLGLGIDEPAASWGSLLKAGAQVVNPVESRWWLLVFPAALMSATLLALNFLGDGLRDAFDPRSKE